MGEQEYVWRIEQESGDQWAEIGASQTLRDAEAVATAVHRVTGRDMRVVFRGPLRRHTDHTGTPRPGAAPLADGEVVAWFPHQTDEPPGD